MPEGLKLKGQPLGNPFYFSQDRRYWWSSADIFQEGQDKKVDRLWPDVARTLNNRQLCVCVCNSRDSLFHHQTDGKHCEELQEASLYITIVNKSY